MGSRVSRRSTSARSATSQVSRDTWAPSAVSSATRVSAPSAARPRRDTSSRDRTPCRVTRWRATDRPRVPVAPVTSTVPAARSGVPAPVVAGTASGCRTRPSRTALCGRERATAANRAVPSASSASPGRSTSWKRPGCSAWPERTMPHRAAPATSGVPVSGPAFTALRVTNTSRESVNRSSASQPHIRSWARVRWPRTVSGMPGPPVRYGTGAIRTTSGMVMPVSTALPRASRSA